MAGETRGKGPFAKRQRAERTAVELRWSAPRIDLTSDNIAELITFAERKCDPAVAKQLTTLAQMPPEYRLAKNLSELLRQMAAKEVTSVLDNGISDSENATLAALEQYGIPVELLGVAHALLNIRERQMLVSSVCDFFYEHKTKV